MDVWTPSLWSPYGASHRGSLDRVHCFGRPYQQHPVYRVPPVYPPPLPPPSSSSSYSASEHFGGPTGSPPLSSSPPSLPHHQAALPPRPHPRPHAQAPVPRSHQCQQERRGLRLCSSGAEARGPGDGGGAARCPPRASCGGREEEEDEEESGDEEAEVGESRRDPSPISTGDEQPDGRSYCKVLTFQDPNGQSRKMVFPKALDLDRPKRARTSFTTYQLDRLEAEFKSNQYMVGRDRAQLASDLGLTETQVKVWFQNRRTKHKREQCREAEFQEKNAESIAACNILRLLQNRQLKTDAPMAPSADPTSPIVSSLVPW